MWSGWRLGWRFSWGTTMFSSTRRNSLTSWSRPASSLRSPRPWPACSRLLNDPAPELVASLLAPPQGLERGPSLCRRAGRQPHRHRNPEQGEHAQCGRTDSLLAASGCDARFGGSDGRIVLGDAAETSPRSVIAKAIRRRAFALHDQRIIELATNACVGAGGHEHFEWPDLARADRTRLRRHRKSASHHRRSSQARVSGRHR